MYNDTLKIYKKYWFAYGGFSSLVKSFYLHVAIVLLVLTYSIWTNEGWWDLSIAILTSLISFTIAGYAMIMAFGDKKFFQLLSKVDENGEPPPFQIINSTFFHFILVQVISLFLALIAKARPVSSLPDSILQWVCDLYPKFELVRPMLGHAYWAVGFFMLLYSLALALAAATAIFQMIDWYSKYALISKEDDSQNEDA